MKIVFIRNFKVIVISILIMISLAFFAYDFWWQIIDYSSYTANHTLTLIPTPTALIWIGAIVLTILFFLVSSSMFSFIIGYHTVKIVLAIYNISMLFAALYYLPRLWDYGAAIYVNGNLISRKLTFDESFYGIYLPIGVSILLTYVLYKMLKFWINKLTREYFL